MSENAPKQPDDTSSITPTPTPSLTPTLTPNPETTVTTSNGPVRTRTTRTASHSLSSAASPGVISSRKGSSAVSTQETHSERANISMPPPPSRPLPKSRTSSEYSQRGPLSPDWRQDGVNSSANRTSKDDFAIEEDTPRLLSGTMADDSKHSALPDPALRTSPSLQDFEGKRMSVSSMYSLSSVRAGGVPSSAASTNGSDVGAGTNSRTPSTSLTSVKGLGISQAETFTSAISVTTSSANQFGSQGTATNYQLVPRETQAQSSEIAKRNAVQRGEGIPRQQAPTRDRSRAKRRFSGSTGASSHSPSSERKKDEEPKQPPLGIIGVCALDVKARSKPSRNILQRLIAKGEFEVKVFGDKVILDEEIENWPICDFLICFYSDGFPLDKAIAYVKARKPFCVNDVPMQKILWDRRIILRILDKINVPTPRRVEVNRDGGPSILTPDMARHLKDTTGVVLEGPDDGTGGQIVAPRVVELLDDGDTLSIDGTLLKKPFIEKPVSGEDHNLCIYYPKSEGGGGTKLFRKIGNKSSEKVPGLSIPRAILEPESSWVYEKVMPVDNSEDVKAYTVGPKYCHAETRKSPLVDGLVRRNTHGKEIRYKTTLSPEETKMASLIAQSFGQRVCGFDLLRCGGKSYVIDVNGWSFVKDNDEYYDHSAKIMREMFISEKQKQLAGTIPASVSTSDSANPPPGKKDATTKEGGHRSTFKTILAHSPSMSKLHGHHSKTPLDSPEPSSASTPRTSPPGLDRGFSPAIGSIPPTPQLPPPVISLSSASPALAAQSTPFLGTTDANEDMPPPAPKHTWKLKGMVSVIRHADRTPKQKYKFTFHTKPFIDLLRGHEEEVLLTGEAALASVMAAVDQAFQEGLEDREKLRTLKTALTKKGGWIGTKVQIKPMFTKKKVAEKAPVDSAQARIPSQKAPVSDAPTDGPDTQLRRSLTRNDSVSDTTLSRITAAENSLVLDKLQLIVKWGGEPTHSARYQAQELGDTMRNDLMLMNKEVLDEVHVFSSSERRVTASAQIFAAAFTGKKDLASDFITIRKDLLDDSNAAKDEMDKVKKKLKTLLREGEKPPPQFAWPADIDEPSKIQQYLVDLMAEHRKIMRQNYSKLYGGASSSLNAIANPGEKGRTDSPASGSAMSQATATSTIQPRWCCGEDAELFRERWEKLFAEFCDSEKVDPSKISELYDTMKFDALHNRQFLEWVFTPGQPTPEEEQRKKLAADLAAETKKSEGNANGKEKDKSKESEEKKNNNNQSGSLERSENNRSLHRRIFRRKSIETESIFKLSATGNNSKSSTDARLGPLRELYKLAKVLFDFICPQEYGMTDHEKLEIGLLTSLPLLKEIVQDLEEMQASDEAKSFIYFTKESHIYTLLNCILEGGVETKIKRSAIPELDYLSQICFELYESENKTPADAPLGDAAKYAYSIRITISPGCHTFDPLDVQLDSKHCISCAPRRSLTAHADWQVVIGTLKAKFHQVKLPKSFLSVNLSETHTFHKKEEQEEAPLEETPLPAVEEQETPSSNDKLQIPEESKVASSEDTTSAEASPGSGSGTKE